MPDTIYAVTRVHNNEQNMLDRPDIERLLAAKTVGDALRMLRDKGWGAQDAPDGDIDGFLAAERARAWAFVEELVKDMKPFELFRLGADYHNLKAAIKLCHAGHLDEEAARYLLPGGTIPAEHIVKAVRTRDDSALPPEMADVAKKAYEALLHTGSGQAADFVVDAGAIVAIDRAGKGSPSGLLRAWARIQADAAIVKIALRGARMGLKRDALEIAIPEAGSLDRMKMIRAALLGAEAVLAALKETEYADAAEAGLKGIAALERWFDDRMMERLRPQRYVYEGIEPIAAYLIGREREIEAVRLILTAKLNVMGDELIQERLRALYV